MLQNHCGFYMMIHTVTAVVLHIQVNYVTLYTMQYYSTTSVLQLTD
jgi:hypothetical protein